MAPVNVVLVTENLVQFESVFHKAHVQHDAHSGDWSVWIDNKFYKRYIERNRAIDEACLKCSEEPKE